MSILAGLMMTAVAILAVKLIGERPARGKWAVRSNRFSLAFENRMRGPVLFVMKPLFYVVTAFAVLASVVGGVIWFGIGWVVFIALYWYTLRD